MSADRLKCLASMRTAVGCIGLAAVWTAPNVLAQTRLPPVHFYGWLVPEITVAGTSGAADPGAARSTLVGAGTGGDLRRRASVDGAESRLGVRLREDLGGGFKVIAQIESMASLDRGTALWGSRDTYAGMDGSLGTLRVGRMSTVYRAYGDRFDLLGVAEGNFVSASGVLAHPGFGTAAADAHFHQRRSNSIVYDSPRFGPWDFAMQYAPQELDASSGLYERPYLASFGARYSAPGYRIALAHEIHFNLFGGSRTQTAGLPGNETVQGAKSRDTATRLSVEFRAGAHRVTGDASWTRYAERGGPPGSFAQYRNGATAIGWEARWGGSWRTAIQYARAAAGTCALTGGSACDTAGLEGSQLAIGAGYALSRRTGLFLLAARLANGASATYGNLENAQPARGAQITQTAVGVSHAF